MATYKSFEDLPVWQEARRLAKKVHELIQNNNSLLRDFELVRQLKRSAGSVMDNIAEGFERDGNAEFIYFLSISKGSSGEVQSQLYRALDNGYLDETVATITINEFKALSAQIRNLIIYLNKSGVKGNKFIKPKTTNES